MLRPSRIDPLDPVLFVPYTVNLIERHGLSAHLYADDTQCTARASWPTDVVSFSTILTRCVDETSGWMKSNRLQSNPNKVQVFVAWRIDVSIVFGDSRRFLRQSPNSATVAVFCDSRRFRRQIVAEIGDYSRQCGQWGVPVEPDRWCWGQSEQKP